MLTLTANGLIRQPHPVRTEDHTRLVIDKSIFTPRNVLSHNLRALMAAHLELTSQSALHKRSRVAQATIGRILGPRGENARIETVERLARAFGLEGWQLLVPGMEPSNPPVLQPVTKPERELYERLKLVAQDIAKYGGNR